MPNGEKEEDEPLPFRNKKKRPVKIDNGNNNFRKIEEMILLGPDARSDEVETEISML